MSSLLYSFDSLKKYEKNPCVIWKESVSRELLFNYFDVIREAETLLTTLNELGVVKHSKIIVNIGHSPIILPVILGILNNSCCYCPVNVSEDDILESLDRFQTKYLISNKKLTSLNTYKTSRIVNIFGTEVIVYTFEKKTSRIELPNDILSYAIQTSGSTGEPKIVNVPYSCILPNIVSLSRLFSVQSNDIFLISAPPTFDPFIVDVFMALLNGAAIILVPASLRLVPNIFASIVFRSSTLNATICQMTPSLFRRFNAETLKDIVFHENTTLRVLVLGGEPFPLPEEFLQWPIWNRSNCIRLFNIYGITEVSCWASIKEISEADREISLGQPLDVNLLVRSIDHPYEIIENGFGELYIESSKRKCFINTEDADVITSDTLLSRKTGDLVEKRDQKIFYNSRTDSIVKRFGCKINLKTIENKIKRFDAFVSDVSCVYDSKQSLLIAFIKLAENHTEPSSVYKFFKNFEKAEIPDDVIYIQKFPLSSHGKVSKYKLLEYYRSIRTKAGLDQVSNIKNFMQTKLKQYLDLDIVKTLNYSDSVEEKRFRKQSWDEMSFVDAGGTSFLALRLLSELEEITCQSLRSIFVKLLDENCTLKQIIDDLENIQSDLTIQNTFGHTKYELDLKLNIAWKYNLHKCVDASPTIIKKGSNEIIVAVGSHSHLLVCLDTNEGKEIFTRELPDRIESQIAVNGQHGVVGCYDGVLYKFHIDTGEILHKYDSRGMIKCRPLIVEDFVIFGNYSDTANVFCVELKSFKICWSRKLSSKSCLASPVVFDDNSIIICTLDGLVACISFKIGSSQWEVKLPTPIFSSPVKFLSNKLAVAEVGGRIHCIENGKIICTYDVPASVFSSLVVMDESTLIFGCYDYKVYLIKYCDEKKEFSLLGSILLEAQIYATPTIFEFHYKMYIVACTTKGLVYLIHLENQSVTSRIDLGGEVFSSPAVYNDRIYVGCRDNYLYSIEVKEKD